MTEPIQKIYYLKEVFVMSEYEGITMGDMLSMKDNEINHLKTEKSFETGFMDPTIGQGSLYIENAYRKPYKLVGQQRGAKTSNELQKEIEDKLTVSEYRTLAKTTYNSKKEKIIEFTGLINRLVDEGVFDDFSDENTTETDRNQQETNKKPLNGKHKIIKTDMYVSLKFEVRTPSVNVAMSSITTSLKNLLDSFAHSWRINCLPTIVVGSCSTEISIEIFPNRLFDGTCFTELLKITNTLIQVALYKIIDENDYDCKIFITSNIDHSGLMDLVFPGIDIKNAFQPNDIEAIKLITSALITYVKYGM